MTIEKKIRLKGRVVLRVGVMLPPRDEVVLDLAINGESQGTIPLEPDAAEKIGRELVKLAAEVRARAGRN